MKAKVALAWVGVRGAELHHHRGPGRALRPGASPEGTARLEEPSAGQQLNKRWEGCARLEGHVSAPKTSRCSMRQEGQKTKTAEGHKAGRNIFVSSHFASKEPF